MLGMHPHLFSQPIQPIQPVQPIQPTSPDPAQPSQHSLPFCFSSRAPPRARPPRSDRFGPFFASFSSFWFRRLSHQKDACLIRFRARQRRHLRRSVPPLTYVHRRPRAVVEAAAAATSTGSSSSKQAASSPVDTGRAQTHTQASASPCRPTQYRDGGGWLNHRYTGLLLGGPSNQPASGLHQDIGFDQSSIHRHTGTQTDGQTGRLAD